jgi:hypothetical protein
MEFPAHAFSTLDSFSGCDPEAGITASNLYRRKLLQPLFSTHTVPNGYPNAGTIVAA